MLDDSRVTPAHTNYDGANYYPTSRWVLFGHHFAAIAGAGPLVGPMLAAQFGYAPGLIWLVAGVCPRRRGARLDDPLGLDAPRRPLAGRNRQGGDQPRRRDRRLDRDSLHPRRRAGGPRHQRRQRPRRQPLGDLHHRHDDPARDLHGLLDVCLAQGADHRGDDHRRLRPVARPVGGEPLSHSDSWFASLFDLSRTQIVIALCVYGFAASVLPVWLLLSPRGYLSSFTKIGTIFLLALGVVWVNPEFKMPALSEYAGGGGPIFPGPLFPFCFITIACGAISGFHALISSGTTSKMVDKESDIRPIGYGAMLVECLVGVMALIAAAAMEPGDYFAINVPPAQYANLTFQGVQMAPVHLAGIEASVGETVTGRTGGAVSLAVGMAQIFSAMPGMSGLLAYWYHFAIMFEALFILTTIDSGTRVGRFLMQEFIGKAIPNRSASKEWMPGAMIATGLMVVAWGYFIYTGNIGTIWPMFGVANQLLGVGGARGRDHDPDQHGQDPLHLGHAAAARVPRHQHALRRVPEHPRQLLAACRAAPTPPPIPRATSSPSAPSP